MPQYSSLLLVKLVWILGTSASMIGKRVTIPAPIVVEPSQTFDGNDGPFSSFNISVGTPPQDLKVFISSSLYQTLVVLELGCEGQDDPPNCAALRGGEFFSNESSTWQNNTANISTSIYPMLLDTQLGYNARAQLGFDVVTLGGAPATTLNNQTVGEFAVADSYLGLFGLDPRSSNFSGSPPIPSYLQNLRNQSLIPSLSWGYSAGNQYRSDKAFGSLTLGGYDRSRFTQHDGSWAFDATDNLAVQVQSITGTTGGTSQGFLPTPITATIDSSLPYIWLPQDAYTLFEIAFGLTWDETSSLYLINETLHNSLVQKNTSFTFDLVGMTGGSTANVSITLPYAAFDLTASEPLVNPASRYFPIKRAANPSQYVFGRTFLQEAYVVADYERRNFSVFPCRWDAFSTPDIASTFSPTYNITPPSSPNNDIPPTGKSKGSSNTGAIAGGVVGGLLALAIGAALLYFCWWRPKRRQHYTTDGKLEKSGLNPPSQDPDQSETAGNEPHLTKAELANTQRHELEGSVGLLNGSAGPSKGPMVFEMPAREEVASELRATNENAHEMLTPETAASDAGLAEFPWRRSVMAGATNSPSPLGSPGSPGSGREGIVSPVSSPSPGLPSPIPSPSMIPSAAPTPLPSPPPVQHPQPQRGDGALCSPLNSDESALVFNLMTVAVEMLEL
ncbi:hypothetical protein D0Z07_3295 [Hyphodiscus hymeniophilus]|uniref:Peptidase A1 domain-containing protein n=1 Tax=Hyphodiscus hymeniophilus TaxID=353542 RepID=A0A9P6VM15_9HELO|nr:hypothetical protein D0Z07_3295 [Hyphodiscus hymeniophilus]